MTTTQLQAVRHADPRHAAGHHQERASADVEGRNASEHSRQVGNRVRRGLQVSAVETNANASCAENSFQLIEIVGNRIEKIRAVDGIGPSHYGHHRGAFASTSGNRAARVEGVGKRIGAMTTSAPQVIFDPVTPQAAEGKRLEPTVSMPRLTKHSPAAVAARETTRRRHANIPGSAD
jgi:hypothetical protein